MANYNRFNVSVLCVADSQDDVSLYGAIKSALNAIPKVSVKVINLDLWQDGGTGKTREFDENGNEVFETQVIPQSTENTETEFINDKDENLS
jgi:hypothetical protein